VCKGRGYTCISRPWGVRNYISKEGRMCQMALMPHHNPINFNPDFHDNNIDWFEDTVMYIPYRSFLSLSSRRLSQSPSSKNDWRHFYHLCRPFFAENRPTAIPSKRALGAKKLDRIERVLLYTIATDGRARRAARVSCCTDDDSRQTLMSSRTTGRRGHSWWRNDV